jgi:Ca2+-transporting ATPase
VPIILTVALPLILGWVYPNIFSPVHIIFLELIMGPTCSLVYENEPIEKNSMDQPPRKMTDTFLQWREISISVLQGLVIVVGTMAVYRYAVAKGYNEDLTRTMVFTTLIVANIFLTLVNRSFYYSVITSLKYKNNLMWIALSGTFARDFFKFSSLSLVQLVISSLIGFLSVIWFEGYKFIKRKKCSSAH